MSIIGISGYIGSGKDTVAKMIQYLIGESRISGGIYDRFDLTSKSDYSGISGWQVKKFAGKLKEICSILTGIPVANFELQSVKDRFLGPEWDYYHILNYFNNTRVGQPIGRFPTKEAAIAAEIEIRKSYQWQPDLKSVIEQVSMTVRELLQKMGTDAMRDKVHPNVHINALFADYKAPIPGTPGSDYKFEVSTPNWIISDLRFPNEFEAIKQRGGICIRINRPLNLPFGKELLEKSIRHESETALDNVQFDAVIENNDSLEILLRNVKATLYTLNLLK